MAFNPSEHLIQLPRKHKDPATGQWTTRWDDYLEVKWRLVWFREKYAHGHIETEFLRLDWEQGIAICQATVTDGEGGSATSTGTETRKGFEDFVEKAETRAIGRALAALGIGTQFVGEELNEMPHIVDAPVASTNGQPASAPVTADEVNSLLELARSLGVDLVAFGHDMRRLLGLATGVKVTKKLVRESMTRAQYDTAWQAYSDRLKQEVEQSLADEDVPDHAPPLIMTPMAVEVSHGTPAPVIADMTPVIPSNGPPEPPPDDRLRWGALSRRSLRAGLSASVWDALRQGDYAAAERVIMALEGNGHVP